MCTNIQVEETKLRLYHVKLVRATLDTDITKLEHRSERPCFFHSFAASSFAASSMTRLTFCGDVTFNKDERDVEEGGVHI